jgi:hypothetical protein
VNEHLLDDCTWINVSTYAGTERRLFRLELLLLTHANKPFGFVKVNGACDTQSLELTFNVMILQSTMIVITECKRNVTTAQTKSNKAKRIETSTIKPPET